MVHRSKRILRELEGKLKPFCAVEPVDIPECGWIQDIRKDLGMNRRQLGSRMGMSQQAILGMERNEISGAISLKTLYKAASSLDMHIIYGFRPIYGSVEDFIRNNANKAAERLLLESSCAGSYQELGYSEKLWKAEVNHLSNELMQDRCRTIWD